MQKFRSLLLVAALTIFGVATSHADSVIGYFNLTCESGDCTPSSGNSLTTVATVGQVIFTLNSDGTIAASLTYSGSGTILGFGFNSLAYELTETGFTPGTVDNVGSWGDVFGVQNSGFNAQETNSVGNQISWTILGDSAFTSVWDALNGGSNSSVAFYLLDSNYFEYGAEAVSYTSVPEPSSLLMLGAGALGLLGVFRRKLAR